MKMESEAIAIDFDPFKTRLEPEPTMSIGQAIRLADKRVFRHLKVGAANISAGKLQLAPAPKTNHHNCTAIASVIATFDPTFTLGATAAVADEYNEGYLGTNVTPDKGRVYKIARMGAIGSAGTATPHLFEPLVAAWTTATRVSLIHNAFQGVVEAAAITRRGAGVPLVDLLIGDFGWGQTAGVASVLCDTASTLGAPQISGAVAGSIKDQTDNLGASAEVQVAVCDIMAGADTEYRPQSLKME